MFDSLRSQQARLSQDSEVLASGWLSDSKLLRYEYAAYAIADKVTVDLRREVRPRVLEPAQDFKPALIGQRLDDIQGYHNS